MADKIFADGARFERPNSTAPEFIKGKLSFNADTFTSFLNKHKNIRGYVNLDLKQSKEGKLYLELNDWVKPEAFTVEKDEYGLPPPTGTTSDGNSSEQFKGTYDVSKDIPNKVEPTPEQIEAYIKARDDKEIAENTPF